MTIYQCFVVLALLSQGCKRTPTSEKLIFATSADYPPFEYMERGELKGFEIDLAQWIAKTLGKEAVFEDIGFHAILVSLQSSAVDAAISTMSMTPQREKKFDFSIPYYKEKIALVFLQTESITGIEQLKGLNIGCQMGTIMEYWLKKNAPHSKVVSMDHTSQAIESLKAKHLNAVLMDEAQAVLFSKKNPLLSYRTLDYLGEGYSIVVKKRSRLKKDFDKALQSVEGQMMIKTLEEKWLGNHHDN